MLALFFHFLVNWWFRLQVAPGGVELRARRSQEVRGSPELQNGGPRALNKAWLTTLTKGGPGEPGAWNLEPGAWSLEPGDSSLEPPAWSLEPGAWSLEPRVWSLEPRARSLELRAWNLEPRA